MMTQNNIRESILFALEHQLISMLAEHGFARYPLTGDDKKDRELRMTFPFGCMKRANGANFELIEIQLDKRGGAKFVLNFGVVTPEGVTLPWANIRQTDAVVSDLPEAYRLYSGTLWNTWFAPSWLPTAMHTRAAKAVDEAIALYPEIEAWFENRLIGRHVRRFAYPISEPNESLSN